MHKQRSKNAGIYTQSGINDKIMRLETGNDWKIIEMSFYLLSLFDPFGLFCVFYINIIIFNI